MQSDAKRVLIHAFSDGRVGLDDTELVATNVLVRVRKGRLDLVTVSGDQPKTISEKQRR